jgi:YesN/AraC family two-component response regulator
MRQAGAAMVRASLTHQVLVIDDDPHIAATIVAALKDRYQVHVATDEREGLAVLRRHPIDLLLLDVRLRFSDGLEVLERLRAASNCRVLVLTGYGSKEILLRAMRAKVDDYMDKPFNPFELQERVAALLDESPSDAGPLSKARQRLLHRFDQPHTTESLARSVGLSPSHLRRRFKAVFGCTPMEFLERVRMEQAARLIKGGELSIKEVARKVGYLDANNFSTAFKRFHGSSPQSHRRSADSP